MEGTTPSLSSQPPAGSAAPECLRCRELESRILELETKLRDLEDRLKPPSKRLAPALPPGPAKQPTGKKRGAQHGHTGHIKTFLPSERVKATIPYIPTACTQCDKPLSVDAGPDDRPPTRHQVAELPEIRADVIEYQGHYRTCACCGHENHAAIPAEIRAHAFGPLLSSFIVYMAGDHGASKRSIEEIVEQVFHVPIALGTIANLEAEMSDALVSPYEQARKAVADADVKNLDETGWKEAGKKRWLWVAATWNTVLFLIHPRRNLAALQLLLGRLKGTLVSDRWCTYDHWESDDRQLCWAHVKRNWEKQIERGGLAKTLGCQWLDHQKSVFELWHRLKSDKPLSRKQRSEPFVPHIEALGDILRRGIAGRDTKLARFCESLLDRYHMYWLFAWTEGVEPTNNHAERVQRRAVLWRKRSFGCQSQNGCRFVERILTVVQTLRLQKRNALDYLSQCLTAYRAGTATPSLV